MKRSVSLGLLLLALGATGCWKEEAPPPPPTNTQAAPSGPGGYSSGMPQAMKDKMRGNGAPIK